MAARRRYLRGSRLRTVREAVSEAAAAAARGSGCVLPDRFAIEVARRLGRFDIDASRIDVSVSQCGTDAAFEVRIPGELDRHIRVRIPITCVTDGNCFNVPEE